MIAPAQRPPLKHRISDRALYEARRVIAVALLAERIQQAIRRSKVPIWQIGLFAAWTAAVVGSLVWSLGAWWRILPY